MLTSLDPLRDLSAALPALVPHDEPVGVLRGVSAAALGLPVGIPVACGGGDNMMAAIGTGNVSNGHMDSQPWHVGPLVCQHGYASA